MNRQYVHAGQSAGLPPVAAEPDRACADTDPRVFFPEVGDRSTAALAICRRCPHIEPCLDWAIKTRQEFGVWGGTKPDERAAMIRRTK